MDNLWTKYKNVLLVQVEDFTVENSNLRSVVIPNLSSILNIDRFYIVVLHTTSTSGVAILIPFANRSARASLSYVIGSSIFHVLISIDIKENRIRMIGDFVDGFKNVEILEFRLSNPE